MNSSISVLICTYNRGDLIRDTLISLKNQSETPDQIVIVNAGGRNSAAQILREKNLFNTQYEVINVVNKNLATNRNIGLKSCTGDIVVMTDDDAVVDNDWVKNMKRAFDLYPNAGCVGGLVRDAKGVSLLDRVADACTFPTWKEVTLVRTLPGVNVGYRQKVIRELGDYDETLFRGEDVDYNWRVKVLGWDVLFDPSIIVNHKHRTTWSSLYNQHFMYGKSYLLVRKKWPEMHSVWPSRRNWKAKNILKVIYFFVEPLVYSMRKTINVNGGFALFFGILYVQIGWRLGVLSHLLGRVNE